MTKIYRTYFILIAFLLLSCTNSFCQIKENKNYQDFIKTKFDNHIYFNVKINNASEGNFVYDTGAEGLYLDSLYYLKSKFDFKSIQDAEMAGVGTSRQRIQIIQDTIGFSYSNLQHQSFDTPVLNLKSILGKKVDGILGFGFFKNKVMEVDYENEFIKIYDTITNLSNIKEYDYLPISKINNRLYINGNIQINDTLGINGKFVLDMGCPLALVLTNQIAKDNNLGNINKKVQYYSSNMGVGGKSSGYIFVSKSVAIGDYFFKNVPVYYSSDTIGALSRMDYIGVLGNQILSKYRLVIDPINDRLYLKTTKEFKKDFTIPRLGFSFIDRTDIEKGWLITTMIEHSTAEKAGLKIGDKILKVNDVLVSNINEQDFREKCKIINTLNLSVLRGNVLYNMNFYLKPFL